MIKAKDLIRSFSDASRRVSKKSNRFFIPHKFKESGDVVTDDNFDPRKDLSRLNLDDFRFLSVWRELGWDIDKTATKTNLDSVIAQKIAAKLRYFPFEEARAKALAAIPTPDWIAAKDVESVYKNGRLNDSQHKSLDRLAKITGAFKTTDITFQQNIFNLPKLSPEVEAQFKALAEKALDAELVEEKVA